MCIAFATSDDVISDEKLKCFVAHLKTEGIHEEILSSVESPADLSKCSEVIRVTLQDYFQQLGIHANAKFAECVKRSVEGTGLKNAYLLAQAVKMLDVGWKIWKIGAKEDRFYKLQEVLSVGLKVVQDSCNDVVVKDNFGVDFDNAIHNKKRLTGEQEFCIRKHLVTLDIMDIYSYHLNLNPQSINSDAVNCNSIISTLQEDTYGKMKKSASDCRIAVHRQNNYMEYYMKIEFVLPQISLTPSEIAVERERFVQSVFGIRKKALEKCNE